MATVLFVCLHNAGRSQMSQALFERAAHGSHRAISAGTQPAERVHPEVVEVMREIGIDITHRMPRHLTRQRAEEADVVVTMGCGDECPYIPDKRYIDIAHRTPRHLTRERAEEADVVVTMGCGDECPYVPGKRYIDWDLPDPKGLPLDEVRAVRDDISKRVELLSTDLSSRESAGR